MERLAVMWMLRGVVLKRANLQAPTARERVLFHALTRYEPKWTVPHV